MTREEAIDILRTRIVPTKNWNEIRTAIDMAIEALQTDVVRCKDCKQRRVEGDCTHYYYCDFMGSMCGDNEYCSFGERREP